MNPLFGRAAVFAAVAAMVALPGATATASAPSPAAATSVPATAGVPSTWQVGVRAGTTSFASGPNARCRPLAPDATLAQRRCVVRVEGRFTAEDRGWKGRYQGKATVVYPEQVEGEPLFDSAAFDSGTISYYVREGDGTWVGRLDMYVDLGTGGIYGFPRDLDISYWIEERNEMVGVLRMTGVGVNALDDDLQPVRRFIDRLAFE